MDKQWVVYIVRCSDGTFYTGISNRLDYRINAHNTSKGAKYTSKRIPVVLKWHRPVKDRSEATSCENRIKRFKHFVKQEIIDKDLDMKDVLSITYGKKKVRKNRKWRSR